MPGRGFGASMGSMTSTLHRRSVIAGAPAALALARFGAAQAAQATAPPTQEIVASIAPRGRLLVSFNGANPVLATRDPKTGVVSGVTVDIGRELGRRLGTPVDLKVYDAAVELVPGLAKDHWDVALLAVDPSRAEQVAFTAPYMLIESTYLVRNDAPYQSVADLDRDGMRIAAVEGSAYDLALTRLLKHATLVRAPTTEAAVALYQNDAGMAALAGVRQMLNDTQKARPGYRVLPDSYTRIEMAAGMPHGHEAGFRYLAAFIESVKASGFVRASLDRNGQTGAIVAPLVG